MFILTTIIGAAIPTFWPSSARVLWYFFRYVFVYIRFLPFSLAINLYIAIVVNPPTMGFDETVFWVIFGTVLIPVTIWFGTICIYQAYIHLVLISNSVILANFVADTPYTANLLLGSLAIYLPTAYDMVNDGSKQKRWHLLGLWRREFVTLWRDPGTLPLSEPENDKIGNTIVSGDRERTRMIMEVLGRLATREYERHGFVIGERPRNMSQEEQEARLERMITGLASELGGLVLERPRDRAFPLDTGGFVVGHP